jgi:hypothetical protein
MQCGFVRGFVTQFYFYSSVLPLAVDAVQTAGLVIYEWVSSGAANTRLGAHLEEVLALFGLDDRQQRVRRAADDVELRRSESR